MSDTLTQLSKAVDELESDIVKIDLKYGLTVYQYSDGVKLGAGLSPSGVKVIHGVMEHLMKCECHEGHTGNIPQWFKRKARATIEELSREIRSIATKKSGLSATVFQERKELR